MSRAAVALALLASFAGFACKQASKEAPKAQATLTTGRVSPDGVRTIEIEAGAEGYKPDRIPGKPGEKLKLKFTRTVDGECLSELKTPDGTKVALPKGTPVEVDVTVPADGEVKFACGMDMFFGVIVAEKAS